MDRRRVILIAHRHEKLMNRLSALLEKSGFRVCISVSVEMALADLFSLPVCLVLCDPELADGGSDRLLAGLGNHPRKREIPFAFLLHGNRTSGGPSLLSTDGTHGVIRLPMDGKSFLGHIRKLLAEAPGEDAAGNRPHRGGGQNKGIAARGDRRDTHTDRQPPMNEKRRVPRKTVAPPVTVDISFDSVSWEPGRVLNHSDEGALIETDLRRGPGTRVNVRCTLAGEAITATGSVAHVLLGDNQTHVGIGIHFHHDRSWPKILAELIAARPASADTFTPKPEPVDGGSPRSRESGKTVAGRIKTSLPVDVSRDGFLWMAGRIEQFNRRGARIKTPILGKPGETIRIRFKLPETMQVIIGTIASVDLDGTTPLAGMDLLFDQCEAWPDLCAVLEGGDKAPPPDRPLPPEPVAGTGDGAPVPLPGASADDKWVETVLIRKEAPQSRPSSNDRFYHSLIGKTLDNYEVVSFISSGAMGGVFKGWDVALERDVALKVISFDLSSQEEFVRMFFKEARFVSRLNHQNIAQIYYIGNANGTLYCAMEFIHGRTLADILKTEHRLSAGRAAVYLEAVCGALDFVRKKQIIHRDIKPANLMVDGEDVIKIVDFGVAKDHGNPADDPKRKIVGTPYYLSPEAIRESGADYRSDIYSLGATFYHLLAGVPPFSDDSIHGILQSHLTAPIPSLAARAPDTPPELCRVIERMMAKNADERFQDYGDIIRILAALRTAG